MSRKNVRVEIPDNAEELIQLGESIIEKHEEAPATSPLNGLPMAILAALVIQARTKQNALLQLRRDAETATQDRDSLLGHRKDQSSTTEGTLLYLISGVRDVLLGNYRGKEQHLGDFGFNINQTAASNRAGGSNGNATPPAGNPTPETPEATS
jgi:hypothetical protein